MVEKGKPEFLIIGAGKSGSTWLLQILRQHPELFLPRHEVHYFDKEYNYLKGWDWYMSQFESARPDQIWGEKTPEYMAGEKTTIPHQLPQVPLRIYENIPQVKLIAILREPVARAQSQMHHLVRTRRMPAWFSWEQEMNRTKSKGWWIERGYYDDILADYFDLFPKEQILVLFYEEVMQYKAYYLQAVCEFLGVDKNFSFYKLDESINTFSETRPQLYLKYYFPRVAHYLGPVLRPLLPTYKVKAPTHIKKELGKLYTPHNRRLESLLDRDLPW